MRLPVNYALSFGALILLSAGGAVAKEHPEKQAAPATGPAADYPVVIGQPFTIGTTVWTPNDQLNYDAVGYASVGDSSLTRVTGAHKTLPLPSYIEVTALDTGKTILVRLERRGPMVNDVLIELAPAAAAQLGLLPAAHSAIRVRRVNPPEQERAMLRAGGRAPERMETPEGLLKVLRRKLHEQPPLLPPPSTPPTMPTAAPAEAAIKKAGATAKPNAVPPVLPPTSTVISPTKGSPSQSREAARVPSATMPVPKPIKGSLVVQVGAFSGEAGARDLAGKLGATVSRSDKYWRVRLGPFVDRAQAAQALEKAKRAGYSDARIQPAD